MRYSQPLHTDNPLYFTGSYGKLILQKLPKEKDHLGNVLAMVSDKKMGEDEDGDGLVDWYYSQVMSTQMYYPFGWQMSSKSYNYQEMRFDFNDKEADRELLDWQNYGKRMYMKRVVRFNSVDPLNSKYPGLSSYQFASNSPIQGVDLDGEELKIVIRNQGKTKSYINPDAEYIDEKGRQYAKTVVFKKTEEGYKKQSILLEEVGENRPKPSALYNYSKVRKQKNYVQDITDPKTMREKFAEDEKYAEKANDPVEELNRRKQIVQRDLNAPDNEELTKRVVSGLIDAAATIIGKTANFAEFVLSQVLTESAKSAAQKAVENEGKEVIGTEPQGEVKLKD